MNIKSPDKNVQAIIKGKYCGLNLGSYFPYDLDYQPKQYLIEALNNSSYFKGKIVLDDNSVKSIVDSLAYDGYNEINVYGFCLPNKCDPIELSKAITSSNQFIY